MGYSPIRLARQYAKTLYRVRFSLITIAAMMAIGFTTRYSGLDATMGLAFARTGMLYPFFGTLLGWLGVALTGSDTASNVLFGSLQRISANQVGVSPVLMCAANSAGGVMGKMIDAQSIVVASTATEWYGHEGDILRYVFSSQPRARLARRHFGFSASLRSPVHKNGDPLMPRPEPLRHRKHVRAQHRCAPTCPGVNTSTICFFFPHTDMCLFTSAFVPALFSRER